MKVNVDDTNTPVNSMRFRLLSTNMQFRRIAPPGARYPDYSADVNPNEIQIIFDDSYELDSLIETLIEFRAGCHNYMGEWKRQGHR